MKHFKGTLIVRSDVAENITTAFAYLLVQGYDLSLVAFNVERICEAPEVEIEDDACCGALASEASCCQADGEAPPSTIKPNVILSYNGYIEPVQ